jgi:hypothetical protein
MADPRGDGARSSRPRWASGRAVSRQAQPCARSTSTCGTVLATGRVPGFCCGGVERWCWREQFADGEVDVTSTTSTPWLTAASTSRQCARRARLFGRQVTQPTSCVLWVPAAGCATDAAESAGGERRGARALGAGAAFDDWPASSRHPRLQRPLDEARRLVLAESERADDQVRPPVDTDDTRVIWKSLPGNRRRCGYGAARNGRTTQTHLP